MQKKLQKMMEEIKLDLNKCTEITCSLELGHGIVSRRLNILDVFFSNSIYRSKAIPIKFQQAILYISSK